MLMGILTEWISKLTEKRCETTQRLSVRLLMTSHDIGRPRPTNLSEQPRSKYILPKYTARVG